MKINMLTRYNTLGASSRYRYYMYAAHMRESGEQVEVSPFFDEQYLRCLYKGKRAGIFNILKSYWRRLKAILSAGDCLLIEYELFPLLPYYIERVFLKQRKYILNFDDNVWQKYAGKMFLSDKYDALVRNAAGIIVANDFLYEKVSKLNSNIVKIPTVVDLDLYNIKTDKFDKFTLVWIGTPVTYMYLEKYADTLSVLAEKYDFELLVIARKSLEKRKIEGVNMRFVDWSQESETEHLLRSHVGIMPLTDDEFSKGKSAFKLIQYSAAGLPVIASPVGENTKIVDNEKTGFLADSPNEWLEALGKLIDDKKLYSQMAKATKKASKNYSIQKYFPVFQNFIKKQF
jgi:glycosyltransferase involved in cell wall biosynthesis